MEHVFHNDWKLERAIREFFCTIVSVFPVFHTSIFIRLKFIHCIYFYSRQLSCSLVDICNGSRCSCHWTRMCLPSLNFESGCIGTTVSAGHYQYTSSYVSTWKQQSENMMQTRICFITVEKVEDLKRGEQPEEDILYHEYYIIIRWCPARVVLASTSITKSIPAMLLINSDVNRRPDGYGLIQVQVYFICNAL